MAYSSQADIENQLDEAVLVELTDDIGAGSVDAQVASRAIEDADAMIDAYCQSRYAVPLDPVPPIIRQVSVDVAIYNLFSRRGDAVPDNRAERYKNAIKFLEKVAAGQISLGTSTPAPDSSAYEVDIDQADRIFTRDNMGGF